MKNNIAPINSLPKTTLQESSIGIMRDKLSEPSNALYNTSKSKYDFKVKLIEEAKDLNTKEKLEELDKNYDRHNQEVWQNFATFCIVGLSLVGIAVGGPTVIKNIHKIAA